MGANCRSVTNERMRLMESKKLNICIIGLGNAGTEFCKMLINKNEEIRKSIGYDIKITAIAARSKGSLLDIKGIDLEKALKEVEKRGRFSEENISLSDLETIELIRASKADVLIELSTLSIEDGEPAISHIETAFENNMHVITANKGPIAWAFKRLNEIAKNKKLLFLYETTVMDGTPIFNLVKYTLPGCKVKAFKGILNSTTNFILEEMEKGKSYEAAIKEAQRRGFAEADPSLDVEGWDAAAKTAAIANVLMDGDLTPMNIKRQGVSHITAKDIEAAKMEDKKIKLFCEAYIEEGKVVGRVKPTVISNKDIFSNVDATSSILCITTDLMGEICIVEKDPEIEQTAYGIYSDLLTLIKEMENL